VSESTILGRAAAAQRGRRLEYFTIVWNAVEGLLAIAFGVIASSISLIGFGLDSFIELTSGAALLWRMSVDADLERRELNERRALRIVGICFLSLAIYIGYESGRDLMLKRFPEHSLPGIVLACVSLFVMPVLSRAKRKVGSDLNSLAMEADAKQTDFCAYLSAILIVGLALNALFNFWWADPVGALLMAPIIAKEGLGALRGKKCSYCNARTL
jgi:divalent metal cation (Fe/Co/Zn/Cd) transporter